MPWPLVNTCVAERLRSLHQPSYTRIRSAQDCQMLTVKLLSVSVGAMATEVILGMSIFIREMKVFLCIVVFFILIISTFIVILKEDCRNKRQVLHTSKQVIHLVNY
jgi:hypothetical protein